MSKRVIPIRPNYRAIRGICLLVVGLVSITAHSSSNGRELDLRYEDSAAPVALWRTLFETDFLFATVDAGGSGSGASIQGASTDAFASGNINFEVRRLDQSPKSPSVVTMAAVDEASLSNSNLAVTQRFLAHAKYLASNSDSAFESTSPAMVIQSSSGQAGRSATHCAVRDVTSTSCAVSDELRDVIQHIYKHRSTLLATVLSALKNQTLLLDDHSEKIVTIKRSSPEGRIDKIQLVGFIRGVAEDLSAPDAHSRYLISIDDLGAASSAKITIQQRTQDYAPDVESLKFSDG